MDTHVPVMSSLLKETLRQLIYSTAAATFIFHWILYGYCAGARPRQPVPESGMVHPFEVKGRLIYVTSFESLYLSSFFFWFAAIFIVLAINLVAISYGPKYDINQGKVVWGQMDARVNGQRTGILIVLWLSLLTVVWQVSP